MSKSERDRLVVENLEYTRRITMNIVTKIFGGTVNLPSSLSVEDLIATANLNLITAVERYDQEKASIETYIYQRVYGGILDEVRKHCPRSRYSRALGRQLEDAKVAAGEGATVQDVANHLGVDVNRVRQMESTSAPVSTVSIEDATFHADRSASDEDVLLRAEVRELVEGVSEALSDFDALLVGFMYVEDLQVKEVSSITDYDKKRLSRKHSQYIRAIGEAIAKIG
jgi:RNA polymerase sigma factor (sigma-70 family)